MCVITAMIEFNYFDCYVVRINFVLIIVVDSPEMFFFYIYIIITVTTLARYV